MAKLYTPAMAKIDRRKAREAKHRDPNAKSSPTREAWKRLKRNRLAIVGMIVLILIIIVAIIGPWIIPYDYTEYDYDNVLAKPSAEHLMGTDNYGRDILSRLIIGTRISVPVGFLCVIAAFAIGGTLGALAAFYGGKVDMIIMRVIDVLYGIPTIILAILLMVVMGPGIGSLIVAMVCVGWISSARLVRGQVLQLKNMEYVMAARTLGASDRRIIFRHMIPNISGIIITNMTMAIPNAIFTEAFLSYIGIGVQAPKCSWGSLAQAASMVYKLYPYQLIIPAFFICTTMLSLNMLGDGLRDAMDPKLKN